jgi:CTP synthase
MATKRHTTKYIFVIGGVMSGVGKGVTTSSIGTILQSKGYKVSLIKADPYLNVDAGTMNPTEHGEVFVLDSGLETDQDMGNYERFLGVSLPGENYMTNGMVFKTVIDRERALGYKGKCVEPVYHVTEEILRRIKKSTEDTQADIVIMEIGGTIGEYQNAIFIEAARILKIKHPKDVLFVMVAYFPVPHMLGEMKTKPAQNAVRELMSYGVNADFIIARSELPLDQKRKEKMAMATGIESEDIISAPDIDSIYEVPINFEKDGLSSRILKHLELPVRRKDLVEWRNMVAKRRKVTEPLNIAIVGKYFDTGDFVLSDAYLSVIEAIKFSVFSQNYKPHISWLNAKEFESGAVSLDLLKAYDGIIVPGGFGETGVEGKIKAIQYARERKIPYLGLCYGMQLAVIEFARHVVGWEDAHTSEINPASTHVVIDIMPEQKKLMEESNYGATMRLGGYPCILKKGTIARSAYGNGTDEVRERHRHRYEVNPEYIEALEKAGIVFSGVSPDGRLMEIAELPKNVHPFFLGTQFHPEFTAQPLKPQPLFSAFVKAAIGRRKVLEKKEKKSSAAVQ